VTVVHVVAAGEIGGAERMLLDLARPTAPTQELEHRSVCGPSLVGEFRAARGATTTDTGVSGGGVTKRCDGNRRKDEGSKRIGALGRRHVIALFTPNEALRRLFRDSGLEIEDRGSVREGPVPYLASTFGTGDVRWLAAVLERQRARIVHLHTFASQVLGTRAARWVGARVVRTEHSTRVYDDPTCWPFSRWSLRRADAVVFISEHVRSVGLAREPKLRDSTHPQLYVVHNGVDTTHFMPSSSPRPRPHGGRVRFIALGRLDRRKGLDIALEALAEVPEADLAIVGDGEERAALEALASQLGVSERVRFVGYAEDVRSAIAESDVALSSARQEGLGVALLEAMAMERPVVALPTGGVPEVVRDGETGWLASNGSARALARAMQASIDAPDELRRRGAAARARVEDHFSVISMRRGYEAVYARLRP